MVRLCQLSLWNLVNVSGFDNLFVVQLLSCLDLIGIQCNHSNLVEAEPHNYLQLKFEKKD